MPRALSVIQLSCTTDHIKVQTKTCTLYYLHTYFGIISNHLFNNLFTEELQATELCPPTVQNTHVHWGCKLLISKMLSLLRVHDGESFLYFRFERRWFESSIELIPQSVNWMSQVISDKWSWNNFPGSIKYSSTFYYYIYWHFK